MMPDITLIDTDILVDVARGIKEAAGFLDEMKSRRTLAVSAMTKMELIVGCLLPG
jgi:predicted nucleic acid-binding protein